MNPEQMNQAKGIVIKTHNSITVFESHLNLDRLR